MVIIKGHLIAHPHPKKNARMEKELDALIDIHFIAKRTAIINESRFTLWEKKKRFNFWSS
jgi:hypothetical protein